jgi:hypothetical protein
MATPYLTPAAVGGSPIEADARAAGYADAYDEHHAGTTLPELQGRLDRLTEALPALADTFVSYALGYGAAVISLRLQHKARTADQINTAFEEAHR